MRALILTASFLWLISCSTQKQIGRNVQKKFINDSALVNAHVGVSIFDPSSNKFLYDYQGIKYFVPASNTKIISCYAAMKYLGDSLPGINYIETDTAIIILPTGDPSLLHPDYKANPVIDFLKKQTKPIYISDRNWRENALGSGWTWNDYNEDYMVERSPMPIYGNIIKWVQEIDEKAKPADNEFDESISIYSVPEVNWKVKFNPDTNSRSFHVERARTENIYTVTEGTEKKKEQDVPFVTNGIEAVLELLPDSIGHEVYRLNPRSGIDLTKNVKTIYSRPLDSVLRPMMHRSDNFFAEQVLLMVSNKKLGYMSNRRISDTLFRTDLKEAPQLPRWADGSGLSRYDLFTPHTFIYVLNKMKDEFGMNRIRNIFPTGGRGTLASLYRQDSSYIFAKTGSLSGVIALSGFLYTKKNKLLIFSVQVNNHQSNATTIRRRIEAMLAEIRQKY
jgi:D-alanyl-D-alanine carboxypeptidase/D-alanyl-D-alanine-endopeptidase (penicillin-binding protein 4)